LADLKCTNCKHQIVFTDEQNDSLEKKRQRGMPAAMIECPNCRFAVPIDLRKKSTPEPSTNEISYRCPVARCTGWVSFVDPFWGCGACGSVWHEKRNLFEEIVSIKKKYSYRSNSYKNDGTEWLPAPLSEEIPNYEELVEEEKEEKNREFLRG
jgi:hypothetical protein